MNTWTCSVSRDDKRADRSAASVVQKIALTAIVDQAHNSNERPLLRGPTAKPPFGSRLTLSDRFFTPTLIARAAVLSGGWLAGFFSPWRGGGGTSPALPHGSCLGGLAIGGCALSDEVVGLHAPEKGWHWDRVLNRCRALATKIANELRNKGPEHFVDKLSLADVHASLERTAWILEQIIHTPTSTAKGLQEGSRQRHR